MNGPRWIFAAVLFALLLPLTVGLSLWPFDDALIHLRVAENLAAGEGPYFNSDDPISASSSPVWSWTLALLALIGVATPVVIATLNAAFIALGATFSSAALMDRSLSAPRRWLQWYWGALYAALLLPAGGGLMELPATLALSFGALLAIRSERWWGWPLLGLAAGLRFEMLGFGLAIITIHAIRGRRLPGRELVGWVVGCLPWLLYQLLAFGQPLSATIGAKASVYQLGVGDAWRLVAAFFAPAWPRPFSVSQWGAGWLLILCVGGALLLALALLREYRTRERPISIAPPLGLAAVALLVVYVLSGTLVFPWYAPLVMAPLAAATLTVAQRSRPAILAVAVLLWAPFALDLVPTVRAVLFNQPLEYRYFPVNARVGQYRAVGEALFTAYPDATLLTSEVGGLGYGFRGEILDAVGLTSSGIGRYHPMPVPDQRPAGWIGAIPPELVRDRSPELIVSLELFSGALRRSGLLNGYEQVSLPIYYGRDLDAFGLDVDPTLWGGRQLHLWIRRDLDRAAFDAAYRSD